MSNDVKQRLLNSVLACLKINNQLKKYIAPFEPKSKLPECSQYFASCKWTQKMNTGKLFQALNIASRKIICI